MTAAISILKGWSVYTGLFFPNEIKVGDTVQLIDSLRNREIEPHHGLGDSAVLQERGTVMEILDTQPVSCKINFPSHWCFLANVDEVDVIWWK